MMEKQAQVSHPAQDAGEKSGRKTGFLQWLERGMSRLTEGFWELVCEELFAKKLMLSKRFVAVILFLSFSGICTIACLSVFPFQSFPVPFSLLAAVGGFDLWVAKRRVSSFGFCASVFFGVGLSVCFLPHGGVLAVILLLFLLLRLFVGGGKLRESLSARILFSAVFSAAFSLLEWVFFPETSASLASVIFSALFTALLTALFSGLYLFCTQRENVKTAKEDTFFVVLFSKERDIWLFLSALTLAFCCLYALRQTSVLGFSPAYLTACMLALSASLWRGPLYGVLCGAFCGFAAGGESGALALVFAGLFSGLYFAHSRLLAVCLSFLASAGFLLCFSSASAFALCGADLFLAHLIFLGFSGFLAARTKQEEGEVKTGRARSALQEKLALLSRTFTSLSEVFYMATDQSLTPSGELARSLCRAASERVCARCSKSSDCWQQNYGLTEAALQHLSGVLLEKREVSEGDLEPYFKSRCKKTDALCREINRRFQRTCLSEDDPQMPASLLCGEYGSVARLIRGTAQEIEQSEEIDRRSTEAVERVLTELKIPHRSAAVSGGRNARLTVTGVPLNRLSFSTERLLEALEEACGMVFDTPEFVAPFEDATMILSRKRVFELSCARVVRAAGMQPVSGDTTGFFESDSNYFYSLICDGMGSGRDAALTSRLSCIFIEKLLTFSREKGVTLEMLNRFLLSQKEERFSTVDLLEIDFYSGRANFIKAGAAASYIKRGTGLYRIASKTPPAGILGEISAEQTSLSLSDGDCVVMFSDGVVPSEESDAWFAQTLAFAPKKEPKELASYLISKAREHHGENADDMSITVVEIRAA